MIVTFKQLGKYHFEFLHVFNFSCTWHKKTSSCRYNIVTFCHNIAYMVNSFLVSLEISVMMNILYEMIKLLPEKMLNAIYLYCFHNNTSDNITY